MVLSADGNRLFAHLFMSRQVAVYNIADLGKANSLAELARINSAQTEALSPQVLLGKQIFYNAADRRMSRDKYLSCACVTSTATAMAGCGTLPIAAKACVIPSL